ncbi:acyltransferase [Aeromonas salmonicida]|uniref:acyltransferase family protein n=1 Tax=Aeromonas salmonicida TaxID=645 RepID=UPI00259D94C4|nr:acyltransferase [Aeromonas salmonicida]MDM5136554.1 acyltransferase [Aeromonas salmonicida]
MKSTNIEYLSRIDHLRFLAASFVVFVHAYTLFGGQETNNFLIRFFLAGDTGVTLFLVLSGMLFTIIAKGGERTINYKFFIYNRVVRIFPLLLVAWITSMALARGTANVGDALSVLFFSNLQTSPLLTYFGQTWTIAVEFQFYLIFPFLALFLHRYGIGYIIKFSLFWLIWRVVIVAYFGDTLSSDKYLSNHYYYLTILGRLDQLLIGMVVGYLYIKKRDVFTHPILLLIASVIVFFGLIWLRDNGLWYIPTAYVTSFSYVEACMWGLFILCYTSCSIQIPTIIDRSLAKLGELSFSEYIFHGLILYSFHKAVGVISFVDNINLNAVLNFVVVLIVILVFAKMTYGLIEKPFFSFRKKYTE